MSDAVCHWTESGQADRPWVVLTHGMGLDAGNFAPLKQRLERNWRVLAWDMPGHGGSAQIEDVSLLNVSRAFQNVLSEAGVRSAIFIGFSFGGVATQCLARQSPDLIKAMVLYGCFAPFYQPPPLSSMQRKALLAAYQVSPWPLLKKQFSEICALHPAGRADVIRALHHTDKRTFMGMTRVLLESFEPAVEHRFHCPIMMIRCAADTNRTNLSVGAAALTALHPDIVEHEVANAGHCAHWDAPEDLAAAIESFMSEVTANRRKTAAD